MSMVFVPRAAAVCVALSASMGARGAMTFLEVEQTLSGVANVFDYVDFEEQQAFYFSENSASGVNQQFTVQASRDGYGQLIVSGHIYSDFSPFGFSVDAASIVTIPDPDAFIGTAHNGAISGNASALVMFSISSAVEAVYTISGWPFAEFARVDTPQVIAHSAFGASLGGQILLEPGVYVMSGGMGFDDNDDDDSFDDYNSSVAFSIQLIPSPGGLALLPMASVCIARRQRR